MTTTTKFPKIEWDYSIGNPYTNEVEVFSFFDNCNLTNKTKDLTIDEYIDLVQSDQKKDIFQKLRSLPIDDYKKTKSKYLSCITGSCVMNSDGRTKDYIQSLNGLFVVDFDELPDSFNDWSDFKNALSKDEYSYLLHYSASGRGLCMFVKIPTENEFSEIYLSLEEYFFDKYGAVLDPLKDETRLRFISLDPEVVSNQNSKIYTDTKKIVLSDVKPFVKKEMRLDGETPAEAFNNSGEQGLILINNELQSQGWIVSNGYGKSIFHYKYSKDASPRSTVAFYNRDVVLFKVHSTNSGLEKDSYNLYNLYKELTRLDEYNAQKKLNDLGFGNWHEKKVAVASPSSIADTQELQSNAFPIHAFPPLFSEYISDLKDTLNFPIDYTAISVLTAVSTAIGTKFSLKVKDGWDECASIYTCLVGNPGANKTHPINTAFKPLKDKDHERHLEFEDRYNEYLRHEKLSKKAKAEAQEIPMPKLEKSVLNNFTTEILFKRLQENERGCGVVSDEIISFFEGMNNYSKTDQVGIYLTFWNNQPTTIDRVGTPKPLFIKKPFLSIIGGLQINALPKAFPMDKLNNGFLQRFLFAFPDEAIKHPINNNFQNEVLKKLYEKYIYDTYKIEDETILRFKSEAKEYFYNWQRINCDLVNENQETIKGEIYSKFDNHFLRLAILLQIMKDINSVEVEMDAVKGAEILCNYFMNTALKVVAKIQNPKNYFDTLPKNKKQFYSLLQSTFTTGEAIRIGGECDIKERAVKFFLKDNFLFTNTKHGEYKKNA